MIQVEGGVSLSPFDPSPKPTDFLNPFGIALGAPIPPWPPSPDDDRDSQMAAANTLAEIHTTAMSELDRMLAEAGSMRGLARLLVDKLQERELISASDNERLKALLDAYESREQRQVDTATVAGQIQKIHEEAMDDPFTTPNGVAILAIAASNAAPATDTPEESYDAGFADALGAIYGTLVLPGVGTVVGAAGASYVAYHTHVNVTLS